MRTWDVRDEKERTMEAIKGYVDVNYDVRGERDNEISGRIMD